MIDRLQELRDVKYIIKQKAVRANIDISDPLENSNDGSQTMKDFSDRITLSHQYIKEINLITEKLISLKDPINNAIGDTEKS